MEQKIKLWISEELQAPEAIEVALVWGKSISRLKELWEKTVKPKYPHLNLGFSQNWDEDEDHPQTIVTLHNPSKGNLVWTSYPFQDTNWTI